MFPIQQQLINSFKQGLHFHQVPLIMYHVILIVTICLNIFYPVMVRSDEPVQLVYAASEWVPYTSKSEDNLPQGLYIDILESIFEDELGVSFAYLQVPWKRAQYYVEQGEADFIITVATGKRLEYAIASALPVLEIYLHIFTYADHPLKKNIDGIVSKEDIKRLQLTPVTNLGNGWHRDNIDSLGVSTHYVDNEQTAFRIVAEKRADITIEPVYAGYHFINSLNLAGMVEMSPARFGPIKMHLLMSRKSKHLSLLPQINQAIEKLTKNGTLETISAAYRQLK